MHALFQISRNLWLGVVLMVFPKISTLFASRSSGDFKHNFEEGVEYFAVDAKYALIIKISRPHDN
jgi:hypothetical protein